ncbi:ComF family protein [Candidatus Peregrinibacteria bacterium]|nr:ComF family protein [Candidatus Peregrinibacteria bacterium]
MIKKIINTVLNFLFPIYCVGCKKENFHLCKACLEKFPMQISENHINGLTVFAAAEFKKDLPVAELIHRFKYNGAKEIAEILGMLFNNIFPPPTFYIQHSTFLIPVPLHCRRFNFRGFNQSLLLARELSKKWNIPVADILQRHRYTQPQVELDGLERLSNVIDAFSMKNPEQKLNPDATYILIDDVYTTGATLGECAKVLKKRGAEKIFGVVVAKS